MLFSFVLSLRYRKKLGLIIRGTGYKEFEETKTQHCCEGIAEGGITSRQKTYYSVETMAESGDEFSSNQQELAFLMAQLRGEEAPPDKDLKGEALRKYWMDEIRDDGFNIMSAPPHIQDDKEAALLAMQTHGMLLFGISARLQDDFDVVHMAVRGHGVALETASNRIKDTKEIVLTAIQHNGLALKYASARLRNDPIVVLMAISNEGTALKYAGEVFKNQRSFVLCAVKQSGDALENVSDRVKNNEEIVTYAIEQHGEAIRHVSARFRNDKTMVSNAMKTFPGALRYASKKLQCDPEINFKHSLITNKAQNMLIQGRKTQFPHGLWANILAKGSNEPYYLYYYLCNKPDLVKRIEVQEDCETTITTTTSTDVKRSDQSVSNNTILEVVTVWIMIKTIMIRLLLICHLSSENKSRNSSLRGKQM